MSNTSKDLTEKVMQCCICHQYYVINVEGDASGMCDRCHDEPVVSKTEWDSGEITL